MNEREKKERIEGLAEAYANILYESKSSYLDWGSIKIGYIEGFNKGLSVNET